MEQHIDESNKTYLLLYEEFNTNTYPIYAGPDESLARDVSRYVGVHSAIDGDVEMMCQNDFGVFRLYTFDNGKIVSLEISLESESLDKLKWRTIDPDKFDLETQ